MPLSLPARVPVLGALTAVAAGILVAAPSASASVTGISIATAGVKQVNQATYAWGTVHGGNRVRACTQARVGSSWSTSQCVTTTSTGAYTIPLTYGSTRAGTYTYRVVAGGKVSPSATLTRTWGRPAAPKPPTTTPAQPVTDYVKGRPSKGITLSYRFNGVKVYLVQRALGMSPGPYDTTMGDVTTSKVKAFQSSRGLRATGAVDAQTFYALEDYAPNRSVMAGYPFTVDSQVEDAQISPDADRDARVATMVRWARSKMGYRYIWGGTGPMGYDCAGLLLQAMRVGGYSPSGVSNDIDIAPPSALSAAMWKDDEFAPADLDDLQVGDFIYYGTSAGAVGHVSMYVGNGQVLSAATTKTGGNVVQLSPVSQNFGWAKKVGANRIP